MSIPTPSAQRRVGRALRAELGITAMVVAVAGCAAADPSDRPPADGAGSTQTGLSGRVVAEVDVDGDGSRDVVTYRVVDGDRVRIGVRTTAGTTARRVLDTELWPGDGGQWHGAAAMDGRPGAELVVGTSMGAHTPLFTVLSLRGDMLVVEDDPLSGRTEWWVDAFAGGYAGWRRVVDDGTATMVSTMVFRDGGHTWRGERRGFQWDDGWMPAGRRDITIRGDRKAARVGGWHVTGLPRWPDL